MGQGIQQAAVDQGSGNAFLDVFAVLWEPVPVFNRVKEKPRVLVPWLVISALLVVVTVLSAKYYDAAMAGIRASLPPEQAARMGGGGLIGRLIGVPIFTFIGAAIGAGLLWIGVSLSATSARYKTLLSVLMHSYITYILFAVVSVLVLTMRGVESVSGLADLRPPLGLDLLAPGARLFTGQFLNAINPFAIWGVWLCGTGISVTQGVSRSTAIIVTAVVYLIGALLQAAPMLLMKG
ncbi:MAG TPA: YIP1 family protein [Gemmatimonadales bacterium]|nr:YIP1 family protein [Gemmatimonadales bacterium]